MRLVLNVRALSAALTRLSGLVGAIALLMAASPGAVGDIFHLTSGGRVEGDLLEQTDQHYRIRTALGSVTLTADAVERVEPAPSPFQEYEKRRAKAADTPGGQVSLADWCREQDLRRERLVHLRRAIELDPDCEPARRALGYVRVGGLWVEGRTVLERQRPMEGADSRSGLDEDPQKLAAAVQGSWHRRISAFKHALLDSSLDRQVEKGRQRIREIRDPLAIIPLVRVLSGGSILCRRVLVEALARFPDDVATVNLAAIALADPAEEIRRSAIADLVRRGDPRVVAQFRKALESSDDVLIRRAAEAIGALRAAEAIPDLIGALKARRQKWIEVPVRRYFGTMGDLFGVRIARIGSTMVPISPLVAVANPAASLETQRRLMNVTVFRTEVREALRQITGEDFGFDTPAWARWYEEHKS